MLTADRVLPIALGDNWVYALPSSDGALLIDAGPDYDGAWEALLAQLDAGGVALEDVRGVIVTHAHIDHCGLASRWQAAGVPVMGSAAEAPRFEQGDRVIGFQAEQVFALMLSCGVPPERVESFRAGRARLRRALREQGEEAAEARRERNRRRERWPGMIRGTPFRPDRTLADGETVAVGERRVRFVEAPGHTPGNAVAFEEATGALFSGDQLLPHITPNPGIHFTTDGTGARIRSLPAFARSMEKVRALGASHLYPGHGEHVEEVQPSIERTLEHHRKRQERILRFLRDGPLTPYAVLLKFFPHLPDQRLWQATAEVVGQIDALVEAGAVVEETDDAGHTVVRAV